MSITQRPTNAGQGRRTHHCTCQHAPQPYKTPLQALESAARITLNIARTSAVIYTLCHGIPPHI